MLKIALDPSGTNLRRYRSSDLASVRELIHHTIDVCYSGVYPPRAVAFFKEYHSGDKIRERGISGEVVIAECEGTVVATGALVGNEITGVFVRPGFQGRGIGGLVMDRLEQIARAAGHSTVELSVSLPSQGFYTGRGYRVIEDRSLDVGAGERLDYRAASKSIEG